MNEIKTSCAPADSRNLTWDGMNWSKCETYVRKLQARIVKAQKEGRHNKVKTLQWMLTHSFYAKALAVKRVTSNKGKNMEKPNKFDPFGQKESAHLIYHTIAPLKVLMMGVNFILPF